MGIAYFMGEGGERRVVVVCSKALAEKISPKTLLSEMSMHSGSERVRV